MTTAPVTQEIQALGNVSGTVFNIQRYSIHDGPGIRTTVFLKGCPIRCFWCQNPESQQLRPQIMFTRENCTMCGACISRCPIGAISYGESAVITDRKKCTGCGACVPACYFDARAIEGTVKTAAEVLEVALKDKKMYARTGGGLTLSGGDPTMQPDFSEALLKLAKHNKLNTCMESCGQTNWDILERLLKYTDILFFDIKTLDPLKHKEGTGTGNAVILENAKKAAAVVKDMRVRCPMIPGFNDSPEDVKAIADFVTKELRLPSDHFTILKYNKYAEGKYDKLDREDEVKHLEPQTEDYMDALNAVIESA